MTQAETVLDQLLVAAAQGGSRDAFERLTRRWTPRLIRYASRQLGQADPASDAIQDTWIAAIRALRTLRDPARFPAWIYGIARRKCIDHLRRIQRERKLAGQLSADAAAGDAACMAGPDSTTGSDLSAAIARLSPEQREVVNLFYGEDLGIEEIAAILAIPVGTVKSRLFHARQYLKEQTGD